MTIQERLDAVKRRTKLHEAASVGIVLATFVVVFFAAEIILDKTFILDRRFRAAALMGFTALGAVTILCGLVLAARRISNVFAARAIEREFPQLRQSLITYVQMQSGDALGSDYALELIEKNLARDLGTADVAPSMKRRLRGLAFSGLAVSAFFAGLCIFVAGKGLPTCLVRAIRPHAFVAPPTQTRIVEVAPGDLHVLTSTGVGITARMEGGVPAVANVFLSYEEGTWFSVPMKQDGERWTAALPGAQTSYRYFIAAADTRSDVFKVEVLPPPVLTNVGAVLELPAYTKLGERTVPGGDFEALPQTYVTLRGFPNRLLKTASIVFDDGTSVPFRLRGLERAIATFTAEKSGSYRLDLADEHGLRNPNPQRFRIEVREDRAPDVTIVSPAPTAEITPDDKVALTVDAIDDYGIVRMDLVFVRRGQKESRLAVPYAPAGGPRQTFEFSHQEFGLAPPDAMMYWVEVHDRAPKPNVATSSIHVLTMRRRPADDLAGYEPLKKSLRDLAASEATRKKFGLDETAEKTDEMREREAKALEKLRELLEKQRDVVDKIRELGPDRDDALRRIREEIKEMIEQAKRRSDETRDLPSRGVAKQESLADAVASKLAELARRAEALKKQLERENHNDAKRNEQIKQAARKLADAARRLQDASRNLEDREAGQSLDSQTEAARDLEAARKALEDLLAAGLGDDDRRKAEELAKLEEMLRERTEELRERATPDEEERLRKAEKAMRDAQRALQQGDPSSAEDAAEAALDELEDAKESVEPQEPSADIPEEMTKSLAVTLREMLKEQEEIRTATRGLDAKREGGILKKAEVDALRELAKREGVLAERAKEVSRDLEREHAEVYRWMVDAIRSALLEIRDLMETGDRTDGHVQSQQADVIARLQQLIEALKPQPRPPGAGAGGGGGSKPVPVGLEAQIKMLRAVQADILAKTTALRAKAEALTPADRAALDRLFQQQEDIRRLAAELAHALGGGK